MSENEQEQGIEIIGDTAPGVYTNLCGISLTPEEAVLHFLQRTSETQAISVVRVFTSIAHAKRIAAVLVRTLIEHERKLGGAEAKVDSGEDGDASSS
ncbi:MAG: DUF3467 domain-containing protein [Armatimonadetes bacterium]|nr:DUF3467 domain-containing protein [Armatimonadota bacterium]